MSRHFDNAIGEADLTDRRDLGRHQPMLHHVRWDHPSARSKRLQRAVCGSLELPRDVALNSEDVTCPACVTWLEEFEALEI